MLRLVLIFLSRSSGGSIHFSRNIFPPDCILLKYFSILLLISIRFVGIVGVRRRFRFIRLLPRLLVFGHFRFCRCSQRRFRKLLLFLQTLRPFLRRLIGLLLVSRSSFLLLVLAFQKLVPFRDSGLNFGISLCNPKKQIDLTSTVTIFFASSLAIIRILFANASETDSIVLNDLKRK